MRSLTGRVCVITGAGAGLGRQHALLFGREGAHVVVNDLGADGDDAVGAVVDEIRSAGGSAVAHRGDIADSDAAEELLETAVHAFGDVHVLVNNAGILRDRMLVTMSDAEFDSVVRVHMRGHFCPARAFARYWREHNSDETRTSRSIINTASGSGLYGNVGQTNYAGAKAAIAAFTQVWSKELARYGVRVNGLAPVARTALTEGSPAMQGIVGGADAGFDFFDPANVSPLVAYLASAACPFTGHVFAVQGDQIALMRGWGPNTIVTRGQRWEIDEIAESLGPLHSEEPVGDWTALRDYDSLLSR